MLANRLGVACNPYQGDVKKVLTVCSGGILRSPTAAHILSSEPYNYNTRAAGMTEEFALVYADEILFTWADEIVYMEDWMFEEANKRYDLRGKQQVVLSVPDRFRYRDSILVEMITERYNDWQVQLLEERNNDGAESKDA